MQFYHEHLEKQLGRAQFLMLLLLDQHHSSRKKSQTRNHSESVSHRDNL